MMTAALMAGRSPLDSVLPPDSPTEDVFSAVIRRSVQAPDTEDADVRVMTDPTLFRGALRLVHSAPLPEAPKDRTIVRFIASSGTDIESPDQMRDEKALFVQGIDYSGWDENRAWLWAHQWDEPWIGRGLSRRVFRRAGGIYELWIETEFTPKDLYPKGHMIGQMHARGFLRACSAGWLGKRIRIIRGKDGRPERIEYLESDLMEVSSCSIPIDKFALQQAARAGILDSDGVEMFARAARLPLSGGVAYEVKESIMAKPITRADITRAFKPEEPRELIEERIFPSDDDASASDAALKAATRAADPEGDAPVETPPATDDAAAPEGEASDPPAEPEATPPGDETKPPADETKPAEAETAEQETAPAAAEPETKGADAPGNLGAAVRGPVSQALDAACDELCGAVGTLYESCRELKWICEMVFYSGRAVALSEEKRAAIRAAVLKRIEEIDAEIRAVELDPETIERQDAGVARQVSRAEAALARVSDALSAARDAITMASAAAPGVEVEYASASDDAAVAGVIAEIELATTRAGMSKGRKKILNLAIALIGTALAEPEADDEDVAEAVVEGAEAKSADQERLDAILRKAEPEVSSLDDATSARLEALTRAAVPEAEAPAPAEEAPADEPAVRTIDISDLVTRASVGLERAATSKPTPAPEPREPEKRLRTFGGVRLPKKQT